MAQRIIGVRVAITRYVSDEPQPGLVECELADVHGRCWTFVEKTAIVSAESLDSRTPYPQPGTIACEILSRRQDDAGREIVRIDTERPWGVESVDGRAQFEVGAEQLVSWLWGSQIEQPWDGHG
jgi:hypothetical protein